MIRSTLATLQTLHFGNLLEDRRNTLPLYMPARANQEQT
jgi:hypothetical protein